MSERFEEKSVVSRVTESTRATLDDAATTAKESSQTAASGAKNYLEKNPLGLALGAIAVGFLIGLVVPMGELEREKVGPVGETIGRQAKGAASDLVTQGKTVVLAAVSSALKKS